NVAFQLPMHSSCYQCVGTVYRFLYGQAWICRDGPVMIRVRTPHYVLVNNLCFHQFGWLNSFYTGIKRLWGRNKCKGSEIIHRLTVQVQVNIRQLTQCVYLASKSKTLAPRGIEQWFDTEAVAC